MHTKLVQGLVRKAVFWHTTVLIACGLALVQCGSDDKAVSNGRIKFENYAAFDLGGVEGTTIHFVSRYTDGPFPWYPTARVDRLPGYDASVTGAFDIIITSDAPRLDPIALVVHVDADFEQTLTARAEDGSVIGTMTLKGKGQETFDVNPATVVVDTAAGVIRRDFGSPLRGGTPVVKATLEEATGIFADIQPVGEWEVFVFAHQIIPLDPTLSLFENLTLTPVETFGEAVTAGTYTFSE